MPFYLSNRTMSLSVWTIFPEFLHMRQNRTYGGLLKWGHPKNGWFIVENPILNGWWLGGPLFQETSICLKARTLQSLKFRASQIGLSLFPNKAIWPLVAARRFHASVRSAKSALRYQGYQLSCRLMSACWIQFSTSAFPWGFDAGWQQGQVSAGFPHDLSILKFLWSPQHLVRSSSWL